MPVSVVDTFPFPFHLAEAQELHATLSDIYPTSSRALFVAARAGLNTALLFADQPAFFLWRDILQESANANKTRDVVQVVRDLNPTNPRRPFLDALLAAQAPSIELQPRAADGAPAFIKSDDDIPENEALLFHDDLTLEIGRVPWLIEVLQALVTVAPSVCRLLVESPGVSSRGTAFRIADELLLTNWHVLHPNGTIAAAVTAEFGYDDDGKGGGLPSTAVVCDAATIKGAPADDWAVISVGQPMPATVPILKLSEAVIPTKLAPAFIIQHPGGERKRIAYVRNQITTYDDRVVQYLSDTQQGSSGSPVLSDQGRLIALHHAGGRPQEVAGKPPLRKNEGIRIPRIVAGLAALGVVVP
jgi:trypsin-like peptidase/effector-associated domain 1 (EAD1)-containing protein